MVVENKTHIQTIKPLGPNIHELVYKHYGCPSHHSNCGHTGVRKRKQFPLNAIIYS